MLTCWLLKGTVATHLDSQYDGRSAVRLMNFWTVETHLKNAKWHLTKPLYSSFSFRFLTLVDLCWGNIGLLNILILATWCLKSYAVKSYYLTFKAIYIYSAMPYCNGKSTSLSNFSHNFLIFSLQLFLKIILEWCNSHAINTCFIK